MYIRQVSVRIGININMNMICGIRRSTVHISISSMHIRISINISVNISINAGIILKIQQIINVSISIGDSIIMISEYGLVFVGVSILI